MTVLFSYLKVNESIYVTDRKHRALIPSFEDRDTIGAVVKFLQPFGVLTDLLSGDREVTISSVLPTLAHITDLCEQTQIPATDTDDLDDVASARTSTLERTVKDGILSYVRDRYSTVLSVGKES